MYTTNTSLGGRCGGGEVHRFCRVELYKRALSRLALDGIGELVPELRTYVPRVSGSASSVYIRNMYVLSFFLSSPHSKIFFWRGGKEFGLDTKILYICFIYVLLDGSCPKERRGGGEGIQIATEMEAPTIFKTF